MNNKNKTHGIEAAWIRELAGILDETGLTEIEIEKSDLRLRVSRAGAANLQAAAPAISATAAVSAPAPDTAAAAPTKLEGAVTSPMVGTVYLSPTPGDDAFVKAGDTVSEGQTLMIVEAMKTMNTIPSPRAGKIKEIIVRDAQPVEYGEPLVIIE